MIDQDEHDDDHARGPSDAPLVIVYADFTCPFCAVAHERLSDRHVRRVFRHLALKAKHPRAVPVARASEAAALQGAFWAFHDAVYADQSRIEDPHLWALVERLGLDLDRFEADRRSDAVADRVRRQTHEAVLAGAMTTPTFFREGRPDQALYNDVVRQREAAKRRPATERGPEERQNTYEQS
ncbi:DsbA family protein [Capillimicrobium parvum]|nr:DsbA family protein [Capillimicrobium parvum]